MDGEIPNTPNIVQLTPSPTSSNEPPHGKKGFLFETLFIIIFLILVFGALNYFNILNLSKIFPNYLGFLPHKSSQQSKQFNNAAIKQLKIPCPSVKEFCEKGEDIVKDGAYVGIGYKLSSGSAIFAAFDGNLTATFSASNIEINGKITQENFPTLYLDNEDLGLRATYFFRGPKGKIKTGQVFKGQQIAEVGVKPIVTYDYNSLIFSLIAGYPSANTPAILNKEDFEY